MNRNGSQIRSHTWRIPSAVVGGQTNSLDSHSACIHPHGAAYTSGRTGALECLTWLRVPYTGRAPGVTAQPLDEENGPSQGPRPECLRTRTGSYLASGRRLDSIPAGSAQRRECHDYFLNASFTFSPACFKLPATLSPLPSASRD